MTASMAGWLRGAAVTASSLVAVVASIALAAAAEIHGEPTSGSPGKPSAVALVNAPGSASGNWCAQIGRRLPGVSGEDCKKSGLVASGGVSSRGQPIMVRRFAAAKAGGAPVVRILLLGGIHGDELTASAIVFQWMQWMHTAPAQNFSWTVVPAANPDGMLAPKPQRVNAHGVDLNRNFPTPGWSQDAPRYWARSTGRDPRRFPGKAPLSEPESRWINEEMERFQPQVIISVHAPFGVLDFDGPAPTPRQFGRLVFNPVGVYPGSLGNYSGVHKNVPVITIELPNAQSMPPPAEVKRIWVDMLTWIQHNVSERSETTAQMKQAAPTVR
ncbi:MAG TPA: M14 family murein peptide amidase A [Burkholderiaceae bacterium]